MPMRTTQTFLLLFVLLAASGCDSTEEDSSRLDLLTNGPWVVENYDVQPDSAEVEVSFPDRFEFNRDGTHVQRSGEETQTAAWRFSDDQTEVVLGEDQLRLGILRLTEEVFEFRIEAPFGVEIDVVTTHP